MIDPLHLANTVLSRTWGAQGSINRMKLSRVMYLTAAHYRRETGLDLFTERFLAWPYGPVLVSVHTGFAPSDAKGTGITRYAKDSAGQAWALDPAPKVDLSIELVRVATAGLSAAELSKLTRAEHSPWRIAWDTTTKIIDPADTIDEPALRALGLGS